MKHRAETRVNFVRPETPRASARGSLRTFIVPQESTLLEERYEKYTGKMHDAVIVIDIRLLKGTGNVLPFLVRQGSVQTVIDAEPRPDYVHLYLKSCPALLVKVIDIKG